MAGDDRAIAAATDPQLLGFSPVEVPGDRALYHAAAVTAGNFATVLLVQASRMLSAAGVSQEEARACSTPAITSLKNAIDHGAAALTGPVARGDNEVIDAHHGMTQLDPALSSYCAASPPSDDNKITGRPSSKVGSSDDPMDQFLIGANTDQSSVVFGEYGGIISIGLGEMLM